MRYTLLLLLMAVLAAGSAWADAGDVDDEAASSDGGSAVSTDSDGDARSTEDASAAQAADHANDAADSETSRDREGAESSPDSDTDDAVTTFGQRAPADGQPSAAEAAEDTGAAEAEQVMRRLLEQRRQIPTIEPVVTGPAAGGAGGQRPDPAVIGVAPDQPAPQLRREGEFVVSRRGRVFILPDSRAQFRFEADAEQSPEAPVFLMPCQLLEHIERLVQQRGDELVFVLSGQVFTYHGANWLLPTMMRLDIRRDDLGQ